MNPNEKQTGLSAEACRPAHKIAILYIATGKYTIFWPDFFSSFERCFLPDCEVHYFVYTDAAALTEGERCPRVHRIFQEPLPWPMATLKRFHLFRPLMPQLAAEGFTHAFFLNANYRCVRPVAEADLLPRVENGEQLTLCLHPGYFTQKPLFYPYSRDPASRAYIPYNRGEHYFCGGTNGGTLAAYTALVNELDDRIEADLAEGTVAAWHDESHLNRYALGRTDVRVLNPSYCCPEGVSLPYPPIFLVRDKSKWLDVTAVKGQEPPCSAWEQKKSNLKAHYLPYWYRLRDSLAGKE